MISKCPLIILAISSLILFSCFDDSEKDSKRTEFNISYENFKFNEKSYPITTSVFFVTSTEEVILDSLECRMMEEIGLDPDNDEDYQLFAYIIRGFDFRFYAWEDDENIFFTQIIKDFAIYIYDLSPNYPINTSIDIVDLSEIYEVPMKQKGAVLKQIFTPLMNNGIPKAILASSPNRENESEIQRQFINIFSSDVYFSSKGTVKFTKFKQNNTTEDIIDFTNMNFPDYELTFTGNYKDELWEGNLIESGEVSKLD